MGARFQRMPERCELIRQQHISLRAFFGEGLSVSGWIYPKEGDWKCDLVSHDTSLMIHDPSLAKRKLYLL